MKIQYLQFLSVRASSGDRSKIDCQYESNYFRHINGVCFDKICFKHNRYWNLLNDRDTTRLTLQNHLYPGKYWENINRILIDIDIDVETCQTSTVSLSPFWNCFLVLAFNLLQVSFSFPCPGLCMRVIESYKSNWTHFFLLDRHRFCIFKSDDNVH